MQKVLGQDHAIGILRVALASGRLHHAWVFSGPRGVGKFTAAVELARILLDPAAQRNLAGDVEAAPDGQTSQLIDAGTHPDLHIVRKELALFADNAQLRFRKLSNIPIDVLRQYMIGGKTSDDRYHEPVVYHTSVHGHGKVFIIDEAELVDRTGQNAMLKTLEEPPPGTYIFLITARPERLLPTIRSRCQHVRFTTLDADAMACWFDQAELDLEPGERAWIERFAEGSPGAAKLAADYGFFNWRATLEPMLTRVERGEYVPEMGEALAGLVDEFATRWVKQNTNASKDAANKDGARQVLSYLAAHVRSGLREGVQLGASIDGALAAIELIRDAEYHLERNVNLKQLLENLVVQWSAAMTSSASATAAR